MKADTATNSELDALRHGSRGSGEFLWASSSFFAMPIANSFLICCGFAMPSPFPCKHLDVVNVAGRHV